MTEDLKNLADVIVNHFKDTNGAIQERFILECNINNQGFGRQSVIYVVSLLSQKGILGIISPTQLNAGVFSPEKVFLTDKGWAYQNFDTLFEQEKHKEDLENALITSSIQSNTTGIKVNRLFWLTALFALGSFAVQALTYFSDNEKSDLRLQVLKRDSLIQSQQMMLLQKENAQRKAPLEQPISKVSLKDSTAK